MSIGKVGGGGKKGGASGAKGAKGTSGSTFASRVGATSTLVGPSGAVGSSNVPALEPLTAQAVEIAKQLKAGLLKSKEEATKTLVSCLLREKVRMQSSALTEKISQSLQDDPRLNAALERLWANVE